MKAVTDQSFQADVLDEKGKTVLLDFWAEWCGPCKMMMPVLEAIDEKYAERLSVCKLDTDANPVTAQEYRITGIPCCILFKDGTEIARIVGYKSQDDMETELKPHL